MFSRKKLTQIPEKKAEFKKSYNEKVKAVGHF